MRLHCDRTDQGLFIHIGAENRPLVLHVPGFNEDALSHAGYALMLAHTGIDVYVFDPPWTVTPDQIQAHPFMLWELFDRMDARLAQTRAQWATRPRIGVSGFSMGGLWASRWLTEGDRGPVAAAALVLASADYSFMPRVTIDAFPALAGAVPDGQLAQLEVAMRAQSPIRDLSRLPPTRLLTINVEDDPRLPRHNAERFHAALLETYASAGTPHALETALLPGDEHRFRRAFQQRLVAWFGEALRTS